MNKKSIQVAGTLDSMPSLRAALYTALQERNITLDKPEGEYSVDVLINHLLAEYDKDHEIAEKLRDLRRHIVSNAEPFAGEFTRR
jgi:hypothetical protein